MTQHSLEEAPSSTLRPWRRWTRASDNRQILSAALLIGTMTLGVKLAAMARDLIVAASFGTGDTLDAFLMAFMLPSFATNVIAGSITAALIPTYIQTRDQHGHARAQHLFSGVMVATIGLLAATTVLLAVASPVLLGWLASGFAPAKLALTRELTTIMLPCVMLSGIITLWSSVLNAHERFALSAVCPVAIPLVSAVALLAVRPAWGGHALAAGLVVGYSLQLALLGWALKRQGHRLWPRWSGLDPAISHVIGQYSPMVAGALLLGSAPLVDQSMAAILGPGSVATLNYGNKVVTLMLSVGTMALGTAVLPYFSKMVAARRWEGVRHTLRTYSVLILAATLPITFLLVFKSEFLVRVVFERGAFTPADTRIVARVQALSAIQIPFYSLAILFVRLISSLRANHILMYGTLISTILNVALNLVLMKPLGVAGIALSTSLVYVASFLFLAFMLHRLLRSEEAACV